MIYFGLGLFLVGMLALIRLHRVRELHHLYYGIVLFAFGMALGHSWVEWAGIVLLADDAFQHFVEAIGWRARMDDFTPIHKLGAWIVRIFEHGN